MAVTWRVCNVAGCAEWVRGAGRCARHQPPDNRPSAAARGYGARWRRIRAAFLHFNPVCADCGEPATVPDHDPVSRAELVRRGDPEPDAWHHLRPRCKPCHDRRTAADTPGGWARDGKPIDA